MNDFIISTVIPCFNGSKYIAEAIDSILDQTGIVSEIIVVDDGSQDDSCQIVEAYGDRVKLIKKKNGGAAEARNAGIEVAQGKYIAFLDADDRFLPDKLFAHVDFMENAKNCVLTHSNIKVFGDVSNLNNRRRLEHNESDNVPCGSVFNSLFEWNHILASTVVVRKDVFVASGNFNVLFRYCEDYEAWLRLSLEGEFHYIDKITTEYRLHENNISRHDVLMDVGRVVARDVSINLPSVRNGGSINYLRHRLVELAGDFGYGLYKRGHPSEARFVLRIGLKHKPFDLRILKMFIASFMQFGKR